MDSCNQGGYNQEQGIVGGGECNSCQILQGMENYLRDIYNTISSLLSDKADSKETTSVGDVADNIKGYAKPIDGYQNDQNNNNKFFEGTIKNYMDELNKAYSNSMDKFSKMMESVQQQFSRSSQDTGSSQERAKRFLEENYFGNTNTPVFGALSEYIGDSTATTANNFANIVASLGVALPSVSQKMYEFTSNKEDSQKWLAGMLQTSAMANQTVASGLGAGSYDEHLSKIFSKYGDDLESATKALHDFIDGLNRGTSSVRESTMGRVGLAAGGILAAGVAYETSQILSPFQSGAEGSERSTKFMGTAGGVLGTVSGALVAGGLAASGTVIGTIPGLAITAAGTALGYMAGSELGVQLNTRSSLSTLGLNTGLTSKVGSHVQEAAENYFAMSAAISHSKELFDFNYNQGREFTKENVFGTFAMNDQQRGALFAQMMQSGRLDNYSIKKSRKDIDELHISGKQYQDALAALQYSPSAVAGQNLNNLAVEAIRANRVSPLLSQADIQYQNAGFLEKTRADALSTAIFGDSYKDILEKVSSGKITRPELQERLRETGLTEGMLKDTSRELYNLLAGTAKGDPQRIDKEQLSVLKNILKVIEKQEQKKIQKDNAIRRKMVDSHPWVYPYINFSG